MWTGAGQIGPPVRNPATYPQPVQLRTRGLSRAPVAFFSPRGWYAPQLRSMDVGAGVIDA
jgi:hypothetical protein